VNELELPSGKIANPLERLLAFCRAEYAYYDAIPSADPNRIDPLDVLVTVAMNSYVDRAVKVRRVHQGLAGNCDQLLAALPEEADLLDLHRWNEPLRALLHAAVQAPFVLIPVATKVLHRKRRFLIPMLDNVVLNHYLSSPDLSRLLPATQDKKRAANAAMEALARFRVDLVHAQDGIKSLRSSLARESFLMTPIRVLEILIWTEVEPVGYYR